MPPETKDIIAQLPPSLQGVAYIVFFMLAVGAAWVSIRRGHAKEGERDDADRSDELEELLESSPVKEFFDAIKALADNARLQTEALKVCSAALGAIAKTVEADFNESQVHREVERRLAIERRGS